MGLDVLWEDDAVAFGGGNVSEVYDDARGASVECAVDRMVVGVFGTVSLILTWSWLSKN